MTATAKTEISPVAHVYMNLTWLLEGWDQHNKSTRAKVADPNMSISSFNVEDMMQAAGREEPTRLLTRIKETIGSYLTFDETGKYPTGIGATDDEQEALTYLAERTESMTERFMEWHKPNSTSNAHVEIELYKHEAYKEALTALKIRK